MAKKGQSTESTSGRRGLDGRIHRHPESEAIYLKTLASAPYLLISKNTPQLQRPKLKSSSDLDDDESGQTFPLAGKHIITINGNHREERQRFTVLHEIAHIVLELPSQHHGTNMTTSDLVSYRHRPKEEILCDVFAAECLLPYVQFRKDVEDMDVSLDEVKELANHYQASVTSTGSRFAVNCNIPCAFVLMERGKVRYVSMSKFLRERKGWIEFGVPVPKGSVAERISKSTSTFRTTMKCQRMSGLRTA